MSEGGVGRRLEIPGVLFEVTERCNLRCRYCYNVYKRPGAERPATSSFEEAHRTLSHLFQIADVGRVTMSGGEPFLAPRFTDLVRFCRENDKGVLITSNGNGGTDEQYEEVVGMGVRTVVVPFHSVRPEEHDEMSGLPGSQERSFESLLKLRALGASAIPIIVLTSVNVGSLEETLLHLKRNRFRRIIVNRLNLGGRALEEAKSLAIDNEELRSAYRVVNDIAVRCGLWVSANICTPHCVLNPWDYPRIGFGACDINLLNRPITLDASGNVRFCNHSPTVMGNIFDTGLEEILSSEYALRWRDTVPDQCDGCARWKECVGGCRAAAEQMGLDMGTVDPIAWREGPILRIPGSP